MVGGVLFNHESPRRGPEMVTRKITRMAAAWVRGEHVKAQLGNLNARRDWGFAGDYVKAMHAMVQAPDPNDYVIGTGQSHSVAQFATQVLIGLNGLVGNGSEQVRLEDYVEVDPRLLRTGEIHDLRADASRVYNDLGWKPEVDFRGLVRMMVEADVAAANEKVTAQPAAAD